MHSLQDKHIHVAVHTHATANHSFRILRHTPPQTQHGTHTRHTSRANLTDTCAFLSSQKDINGGTRCFSYGKYLFYLCDPVDALSNIEVDYHVMNKSGCV